MITYDKSPAPPSRKSGPREKPFIDYGKSPRPGPQRAYVRYDQTYLPGLTPQTLVLPLRPNRANVGVNFTEREETIKLLDLGQHITEQVRDGLRVSDDEAAKTFHWYVGAVRGAGVLDESAMTQMEKFATRFETISNPKDLLRDQVEPFLTNLIPTARENGDT